MTTGVGSPMDARIRPATRHDAEGIAEVHVRSWQAAYRGLVPDPILDGLTVEGRLPLWEAVLSDPRSGSRTWVAEADGRVVGFAGTGPAREADGRLGELYTIYLLPAYWGRGIGSALLDQAVEGLRRDGFPAAILWVLEANQATRRFYERRGWHDDGGRGAERMDDAELPVVRYRIEL